jgi:GTP-binding protein
LELKLLADVGLVGLPNAGKSTLISRISAARPKIADYPFTTIVPNLGVVKYRDETFVVADMPGLIQGASEGIGLGHQFLKHVERCRALVHVVDTFPIDESDPLENYHLIEAELKAYREDIWARPRLIALNKADILPRESFGPLRQKFEALGVPLVIVSAVTGEGMERLLDALCDLLASSAPEEDTLLIPVLKVTDEAFWDVEINEEGYRLIGKRLLRMVAMTDLENEEAVRYLQRRLERIGVLDRLRNLGIEEGDEVEIGEFSFNFTDES